MDATLTVYMKEGDYPDNGIVHTISGGNRSTYTIGRGGPVDLPIALPHISANQAAVFPPVHDHPTWRLQDTSTNGTIVNAKVVGKHKKIELKGGEKINFSVRPYPYATFQIISEDTPPDDGVASQSSKRRRGSTNGPAPDANGDAAAAEKRLSKMRAQVASMSEEVSKAKRAVEEKEAQLAAAENAAAAASKQHQADLAEREALAVEAVQAMQEEARDQQRAHATAVDAASAARHELEQKLAAAEEAFSSKLTGLAAAQEQAAADRAQREASEAALAEKAEALAKSTDEVADLTRRVASASESEASAKREAAAAAAALEVAQRLAADAEKARDEIAAKIEMLRTEAAALHNEKVNSSEAVRASADKVSEAMGKAGEWQRRHDELLACVEAEREGAVADKTRLQNELIQARTESRSASEKLAASLRRAQQSEERAVSLLTQVSSANSVIEGIMTHSHKLIDAIQAARDMSTTHSVDAFLGSASLSQHEDYGLGGDAMPVQARTDLFDDGVTQSEVDGAPTQHGRTCATAWGDEGGTQCEGSAMLTSPDRAHVPYPAGAMQSVAEVPQEADDEQEGARAPRAASNLGTQDEGSNDCGAAEGSVNGRAPGVHTGSDSCLEECDGVADDNDTQAEEDDGEEDWKHNLRHKLDRGPSEARAQASAQPMNMGYENYGETCVYDDDE